jgi:hypothetical protein
VLPGTLEAIAGDGVGVGMTAVMAAVGAAAERHGGNGVGYFFILPATTASLVPVSPDAAVVFVVVGLASALIAVSGGYCDSRGSKDK